MKKVKLITDGACLGNPGPGGWACILRYNEHKKEIWGAERYTTNNRMELKAAIEGLRALKQGCEVEVVTGRESGLAAMADHLSPLDAITRLHIDST